MSQAIKYESTTVEPTKSATEIADLVRKYGGSRFEMMWDDHARLVGIRFALPHDRVGEVPVRLMARAENIEALIHERKPYTRRMRRTRAEYEEDTKDTAYRVAWRQLKDFVEQSLLAVETGLFMMHEAFMAQVETPDPETGLTITVGELFERYAALDGGSLRLTPGPPTVEADYRIEP